MSAPFKSRLGRASAATLVCAALGLPAGARASTDRAARIELTTNATLYGVGLGVYTSMELELNPRPAAWLSAGLGGGLLYGSLKAGDALSLTAADVRLIESSGAWLAVDTFLLEAMSDAVDSELMVPSLFAAAAAGAGAAVALRNTLRPSEGQMSLVNSGGLWGPTGGVLLGLTLHLGDGEHWARDLLVLNLAGLGTSVGLAQRYDPTREQVLYLDAGLLLGGLCGALTGSFLALAADAWEPITGMALVGMGTGAYVALDAAGFDRAGARRGKAGGATGTSAAPLMFTLAAGAF